MRGKKKGCLFVHCLDWLVLSLDENTKEIVVCCCVCAKRRNENFICGKLSLVAVAKVDQISGPTWFIYTKNKSLD